MKFQILILSFILRLILILPLISSPLIIGLFILFIALNLSAWIGVLGIRWFGLILFLVYIGGILVIFIYFVAITPNQQYEKAIFYLELLRFLRIYMLLKWKWEFLEKRFRTEFLFNREIIIFSFSQGLIFIIIFIILFIRLVIVVKVTRLVQGPLRPFK